MKFYKKIIKYINKHAIYRIVYYLLTNWRFCDHIPPYIRCNIKTHLFMLKQDLELGQRTDTCKFMYHLVYNSDDKIDVDGSKLFKTYDGDIFIYTDRFGEESTITWKEYKKFMINNYGIKRKCKLLTIKEPRFRLCSIVIRPNDVDNVIPRYLHGKYMITPTGWLYTYPYTWDRLGEVRFEDTRAIRRSLSCRGKRYC